MFITGTNTDIGKTLVSALILAAAKAQQIPLCYFKPIQSGPCSDTATVKSLAELDDSRIVQPVFSFAAPIAPSRAAALEGKIVTLEPITKRLQNHPTPCLVEGAGGLLCPIGEKLSIRDLIQALNMPALLVASTQLGTINHTLLTIEAAQAANIAIAGIVLSGAADPGLQQTLQTWTTVPIVAEIPQITDFSPPAFRELAVRCFPAELLCRFMLQSSPL